MIKEIGIFVGGVVVGAFAATTLISSKYKKEAEDEISEMREYYRKKEKDILEKADYDRLLMTNEYVVRSEDNEIEAVIDADTVIKGPYIISEDEFAEVPLNYEYHRQIDITYYSGNNVFVKWLEGRVDNPVEYFGADAVEMIKEDNVTEVYVRNDERREDYDIFKENDSFEELEE